MADFKQFCQIYHKLSITKKTSEKIVLNERLYYISKQLIQNIHESFEFYNVIREKLITTESKYTDFVFEIISKCYDIFEEKKLNQSKELKTNCLSFFEYDKLLQLILEEKYNTYNTFEKLQILVRKILSLNKSMYPNRIRSDQWFNYTLKDIKYILKLINSKCSLNDNKMLTSKTKANLLLLSNNNTLSSNISDQIIILMNNLHDNLLTKNYNLEKNKLMLLEEIEYFLTKLKNNDNNDND